MAIYMHFQGIEGNVTAKGFEKWIEVQSFQFGSGRGISTPTGRAANRESSAPSISEVVVTKMMDKASPMLFEQGLVGLTGKEVKIHITRTGKEMETLCTYKFEDTLVASYSVSSGGDAPVESLSLNFVKFEYKYKGSDATGASGGAMTVAYDIGAAKTM